MVKRKIMDEVEALKNLDTAMCNSYDIIIGNITLEELMLNKGGEGLIFAHNVELPATSNDIDNLLNYFTQQEDFERCVELSKLDSE